jgi:UDP-N-acetyl-D-mannosaminuronic acid dehydrogenase
MSINNKFNSSLIENGLELISINVNTKLVDALQLIENVKQHESKNLPIGLCIVTNSKGELVGSLTDGDIRRALIKGEGIGTTLKEVMTKNPICVSNKIQPEDVLIEIKKQNKESGRDRAIRYLFLIDQDQIVTGLINIDKFLISDYKYQKKIGVIGLGYVGLTLALTLAESGYEVFAWDINKDIMNNLRAGKSHVHEVGLVPLLKSELEKTNFKLPNNYYDIRECNTYIICVNTPVYNKTPDLSYLVSSIKELSSLLKSGDLIILRSTIPIGTSRNKVKEIVESETNLLVGKDISVSFAPERTIEGKALEELKTLPQIIAGIDQRSVLTTETIFSKFCNTIVKLDSTEEAEVVKLINNTFRDISFAFANELVIMCESLNLDTTKIIRAANKGYPRNSIPLPSPGVGGPCLSKDPYILNSVNKQIDHISLGIIGRQINSKIPLLISQRILKRLTRLKKDISKSKIFVMGFAFKGRPETTDIRNSPTVDIIRHLLSKNNNIYGWDPIVSENQINSLNINWTTLENGFNGADAILIMNNHEFFDSIDIYSLLKLSASDVVFFDGWSVFNSTEIEKIKKVNYMNLGYLTQIAD